MSEGKRRWREIEFTREGDSERGKKGKRKREFVREGSVNGGRGLREGRGV